MMSKLGENSDKGRRFKAGIHHGLGGDVHRGLDLEVFYFFKVAFSYF